MAAAMGIRNATVRRLAVPDLTTTLLTTALTGLAADSIVAGGSGKGSLRRACSILAMLAGALSGALMLRTGLTLPLGFAAALALATGFAYLTVRRRIRVPPRPATSAPRPRSPPTAAGPATAQLSWSPS